MVGSLSGMVAEGVYYMFMPPSTWITWPLT